MLQKPPATKTTAQLTLVNADERAEAPIGEGYYMIGRDGECQIRPHSSSISDRHCLLEHRVGMLRVFDLESAAGTFVNGKQLVPHRWHFLKDSDELRCGKVAFEVSLKPNPNYSPPPASANAAAPKQKPAAESTPKSESSTKASNTSAGGEEKGDGFDIDEFVDFQDEGEPDSGPVQLTLGAAVDDQTDDDEADVEFQDFQDFGDEEEAPASNDKQATSSQPSDQSGQVDRSSPANQPQSAEAKSDTPAERTKKPDPPKKSSWRKKKPDIPKSRAKASAKIKAPRSFSAPSFSFSDPEQLKLVGAGIVTLAILGLLAYQVMNFVSPSTPRVVIDRNAIISE